MKRPVAVRAAVVLQVVPLAFIASQTDGLSRSATALLVGVWLVFLTGLSLVLWRGGPRAGWLGVGLGLLVAATSSGSLPYFRAGAVLYGLALAGLLIAARGWYWPQSDVDAAQQVR